MKRLPKRLIFSLFFLIPGAALGAGHPLCAPPDAIAAMKVSALQQRFMVAALSCGPAARAEYNSFQRFWHPALLAADQRMQKTFRHILGHAGAKAYHTFKTKLASRAELMRIDDSPHYCTLVHSRYVAILTLHPGPGTPAQLTALEDFAGDRISPSFSWPIPACQPQPEAPQQPAEAGAVPENPTLQPIRTTQGRITQGTEP